ncbi:MAG: NAD(P)H-binding protein, partial [Rhodospirillaceae bacterium]
MSAGQPGDAPAKAGVELPPFAESPVFVAGASGYIGACLVPRLLDAGYAVRCLARSPQKLERRSWARHPRVSIVQGDLFSTADLAALMRGSGAAFYLVHSLLASGDDDNARDAACATRFARAASEAGLARIIYLGGLRETGSNVASRLAGRSAVAIALGAGGVPATVFRAGMILGSGSVSFEILRYLVERQPVMFPPKWVKIDIQPIGVGNVLNYLVACLAEPLTVGRTFDIGGPGIVTYVELMQVMAEELGLRRRLIIPLPVNARRLSAWWISMISPVSREMVRPLADGLTSPVVCHDHDAEALMPQRLLAPRDAIRSALEQDQRSEVESAWSDAGAIP